MNTKDLFLPAKEPFIAWLYTKRSKSIAISFLSGPRICMCISPWMLCSIIRTSTHVNVNDTALSTCGSSFFFVWIRYVMKVNVTDWQIVFRVVWLDNIKFCLSSLLDFMSYVTVTVDVFWGLDGRLEQQALDVCSMPYSETRRFAISYSAYSIIWNRERCTMKMEASVVSEMLLNYVTPHPQRLVCRPRRFVGHIVACYRERRTRWCRHQN